VYLVQSRKGYNLVETLEDKSSSKSVPAEEFTECSGDTSDSFHNYVTEDLEKENNISLSDYKGNVLLVVNLASF